uniref:Defective in cullin neddylation protein n=1 Tax=Tetradesmus obliquus TaxID=3088 RepID=A0A383VM88_TETOB
MNRLNRQQKDKVTQFRSITGASDKQALDCLKQAGWSVEMGIEVFFSLGMQGGSVMDTRAIEQLYLKYKDPQQDMILAEGISRLCDDLGVEPTDIVLLVISFHMGANIMCEYSRDEWVSGMTRMATDSLDKLRAKLPELRAELRDPARFQEVYSFAFGWAREKGQKCLQIETALAMWQLLYADDRHWQYIDDWCEFLQAHHNRAISKDTWVQLFQFTRDTWVQLFQFTRLIKPDFSNFDEAGAWPYLMDEFVDFMKKKNNMAVDS